MVSWCWPQIDTTTANQAIADGHVGEVTDRLMERLPPEAAYFHTRGGREPSRS